jgi:hypothetical protein
MFKLEQSVLINATKENIWKILVDVEGWKLWDKDVKSSQLQGDFAIGTKGTLVSMDNKSSTFFITDIKEPYYYSNYYQYPFFTKLNFTHKIKEMTNICQVTFLAKFTGPLARIFHTPNVARWC